MFKIILQFISALCINKSKWKFTIPITISFQVQVEEVPQHLWPKITFEWITQQKQKFVEVVLSADIPLDQIFAGDEIKKTHEEHWKKVKKTYKNSFSIENLMDEWNGIICAVSWKNKNKL